MASSNSPLESVKATKVEYRRLGKSGFKVSVPILGAMSIGSPEWAPWVLEEEKSLEILKAAYDVGLNTWDTANVYSNGESERIIGKALKKFDIPRSKIFILTKVHGAIIEQTGLRTALSRDEIATSKDYVNQYGLSRGAIFAAVEASLERLQTTYIDLLQIHRFDKNTPIEETLEALHDLVKSGKVRYLGASSMWTYQFATLQFTAEKHGWMKFISMQNHYSLLYREEEREMNKFANETGVGLIPWAPLARGNLARSPSEHGQTKRSENDPSLSDPDREIIQRVGELADKKGWTRSQVALAWISKRVTSPIVGLSSVARLLEAVAVNGMVLTEEEDRYLEAPYRTLPVQGHE